MESRMEKVERALEELQQLMLQGNLDRRGRLCRCRCSGDTAGSGISFSSGSRSRSIPREESPVPDHTIGGHKLELPIFNGEDVHG